MYLNHWDMVSIFVENAGKRKLEELKAKTNNAAPNPAIMPRQIVDIEL
jgi:hypothetical protein